MASLYECAAAVSMTDNDMGPLPCQTIRMRVGKGRAAYRSKEALKYFSHEGTFGPQQLQQLQQNCSKLVINNIKENVLLRGGKFCCKECDLFAEPFSVARCLQNVYNY